MIGGTFSRQSAGALSGATPAYSTVRTESLPDAFWKSLGLFNLSRMVLAGVLLAAIMIYRDGRVFEIGRAHV